MAATTNSFTSSRAIGESARLAALRCTGLGRGASNPALDALASLAARQTGVTMALVSLLDSAVEYFPGQCGLIAPWATTRQGGIPDSMCQFVVANDAEFEVSDASRDARLQDHPAVRGTPIAAYFGVPLRGQGGHVLGSFCLASTEPREWATADRQTARNCARIAEELLSLGALSNTLQEWQEQLEVSFTNAPIGKALISVEGNWLRVNPALCRLLGYRAEDLLHLSPSQVVQPGDRDACEAMMSRLVKGKAPTGSVPARLQRADGGTAWVELHISVVRDTGGAPRYLITQVQDMSDAHGREEELRQLTAELETANEVLSTAIDSALSGENRYRALVDNLPDTAVYVYGPDKRIAVAEGSAISKRGFDKASLIGKHPREFLAAEDAGTMEALLDQALAGAAVSTEMTSVTTGRDLLVDVIPVAQPGGAEAVVVGRDITSVKHSERETAVAGARWRTAFQFAPLPMAELSAELVVLAVNPALEELTGLSAVELEGMFWPDALHPDERDEVLARSRSFVSNTQGRWTAARRVRRGDGGYTATTVYGSMLTREDGSPDRWLVHLVTTDQASPGRISEVLVEP